MSGACRADLYLRLLSMAFFVGGQLVFGLAGLPVLRGGEDRERMRAVARRFGYGSLVALGVLIVTGWALASHFHLWGVSTLQWKLALVGLVVLLTLVHLRWSKLQALQGAILFATLAIVWLGTGTGDGRLRLPFDPHTGTKGNLGGVQPPAGAAIVSRANFPFASSGSPSG